jgi:hypothetical protein
MKHPGHALNAASVPESDPSSPDAHLEHGASEGREYGGLERRRRRVYVTRNTEYHVEDGTCIAVRNRKTHEFVDGHLALERRLEGSLKFFANGSIAPNAGEPQPGESIFFASEGRDLVTSPLETVARPDKETVQAYPTRRKR